MENSLIKRDEFILSSSISFLRNLSGYKFACKNSKEEKKEIYDCIEKVLRDVVGIEKSIKISDMESNFEKLKEKQILRSTSIKNRDIQVIYTKNKDLTVILNEDEHLRLQCIKSGYNIKEIFSYINKIDNLIEDRVNYAFDENLGYIVSNLENIGTGMKLQVIMHLPMLNLKRKVAEILSSSEREKFSILGKYGEREKPYGSLYKITNKITIGYSENEIIDEFEKLIDKLANKEAFYRQEMEGKYSIEIIDKIYRSYGILKNARILDSIETLNLLSDLRLGSENKILDIDKKVIDKAILYSRNSYIRESLNWETKIDKINIERAKVIRSLLN